jgi:UDP-glucose 4-epimerase
MRILITGGAGFIGSHLAEALLLKGNEIYIIDDLSTGSLQNIQLLKDNCPQNTKMFFYENSILDHDILLDLVGTCDMVYHLAAAVGVRYILDNPLKSIQINIQGTEKVLELCARFKKKVLIASSSEVYGKHLHAPLIETDNLIYGPSSKFRWSYAASKLIDEFFAIAYNRMNDLEMVIARLFNTVGPRQTGAYGMVIPRFVQQALNNEPLTVYGDGTQTRTFTHVKDVVKALILLMNTQSAMSEIFNIGGIQEISIKELAQKIIDMSHSSSTIKCIPYEKAFEKDFEDMQRRVPSIEKIAQYTGFKPHYTLDNILEEVIAYFSEKKM